MTKVRLSMNEYWAYYLEESDDRFWDVEVDLTDEERKELREVYEKFAAVQEKIRTNKTLVERKYGDEDENDDDEED